MLSSFRQTTRFLPLSVPHRAFISQNSKNINQQTDEAFSVLQDLIHSEQPTPDSTSPMPETLVGPSQVDLDGMHHFIPPAQSPILQLFAKRIMFHGKYAAASRRISAMLQHIHAMTQSKPLPIVEQAVFLASPAVKLSKQKKGTKVILKPVALSERQRTRLGIDWIIDAANEYGRPGTLMEDRLAREILATATGKGKAVEKKMKLHQEAMVNRGNVGKSR